MEFGVFTYIVPDTFINRCKKYTGFEIRAEENSQILFTYDNDPETIKEFVSNPDCQVSPIYKENDQALLLPQFNVNNDAVPRKFYLQTMKQPLKVFYKEPPHYSRERDQYLSLSLLDIFRKHPHWSNSKASTHNCTYYIIDTIKEYALSMMEMGFNRYLFAYEPKYLEKTEVEQILYELFKS